MIHSREDIETVCGALQTLDALTPLSKRLWELILAHSLGKDGVLTLQAAYKDEHPNSKASMPESFSGTFYKRVRALNEGLPVDDGSALKWGLAELLGYGLRVKVVPNDGGYALTIKRDNPSTYSDGRFLHEFRCSTVWKDPLRVWVPVHNKGAEVDIRLRPVDRPWTPPDDHRGYATFRDSKWENFFPKHNRSHKSHGWCVESFLPCSGNSTSIELTLCPVWFADIVATTLNLKENLPADDRLINGVETIEDWLHKHRGNQSRIIRLSGLTHFPPAANPLTVEINIVANDDRFIVRRYDYEEKKPNSDEKENKNRWEPAIFGYVDSLMDVYRNNVRVPDPSETAFRASCQLLNQAIQPARISWLGVGLGLEFGRVSLFGNVFLNKSSEQIISAAPVRLMAIAAKPEAIRKFGEENPNMREHCKVLLALSLAKLDKSVDIQTSTKPSPKLIAILPNKRSKK